MNVTAYYALLAIGQVRVVTYLNLLAGLIMLLIMAMLIPSYGFLGAALARLVFGPITCLSYFYVFESFWRRKQNRALLQPRIGDVAAIGTDSP